MRIGLCLHQVWFASPKRLAMRTGGTNSMLKQGDHVSQDDILCYVLRQILGSRQHLSFDRSKLCSRQLCNRVSTTLQATTVCLATGTNLGVGAPSASAAAVARCETDGMSETTTKLFGGRRPLSAGCVVELGIRLNARLTFQLAEREYRIRVAERSNRRLIAALTRTGTGYMLLLRFNIFRTVRTLASGPHESKLE